LYKTGDLARYLPDGQIAYLGRVDQQVKLRGFRIELGEIEAVLRAHDAVQSCAVLLREDVPADARLVAYVVPMNNDRRGTIYRAQITDDAPTDGATSDDPTGMIYPAPTTDNPTGTIYRAPTTDEDADSSFVLRPSSFVTQLRAFLAARLIDYMIPSAFVVLDTLPLTPSGKLDRTALPAPDPHADPTTFVAPRIPEEELLARICANVLHRERVGIHDNFFDLGGHSLLATQVVAQVRAVFAVELPLQTLFEQPTVAGLAELLRLAQQAGVREQHPPLLPQPRGAVLPLSFAQQRLWFLAQLAPTSTVYHLPYALRLRGALDRVALARAFAALVARHELLRTTFPLHNGEPTQQIAPPAPRPLVLLDLSALAPKQQEWLAAALTDEVARAPFDLARGPLLRVALLHCAPDAHILLLTMHHIIADGWSQSVLVRDLTAFYAAFHEGHAPDLPALPIQYADYAIWQQRWLAGAGDHAGSPLQAQLVAWHHQLAGAPTRLDLPTDYARPAVRGTRGAQLWQRLSPTLSAGLNALSQQATATPFMMLVAAFTLILARWSGQADILVGAPVAGRTQLETQELVGCFLNTLVLRCDLAGNPSFRALLDRVRAVCLHAYAHQDLPFEQLLEDLHPERALSHTPLFQVFVNMLNVPVTPVALPELTLEPIAPPEQGAKFDLTLYVSERADTFELQLLYDADLFSATRMHELLAQFTLVLEQVVAAPEQPIGQVTLVTPAARALLPDPCVVLPIPHYDLVPTLVAEWAARAPDQIAVCQGARSWTYAALLAAASQVARALLADQLAPGDVVAVSGPRSFGLIASMLGVLLSGGVLLTLDPELPPARQHQMLQVAGASQLLQIGPRTTAVELEGLTGRRLAVDAQTAQLDPAVPASLQGMLPALTPDDDAYLFFTSGTTGIPRGVRGWHHALAHFLAWQRDSFCVAPSDRCAQLTGLSFDVVLRDIFLPLTSGATLCLPDSALALTPSQVLGWLQRQQITMLHCVPTLAQLWLAEPPAEVLQVLRWVGFAGEPLSDALVQRWRALAPGCVIANLYGPTETTLAKACYVVPATPPPGVQPVGMALPQTQTLVLAGSRLCGIGEVGEIVIRTPFRSRGYHNLPADAQPFRRNPFAGDTERGRQGDTETRDAAEPQSAICNLQSAIGTRRQADQETRDAAEPQSAICNLQSAIEDRLYYTGDLGRYRLDGTLDILGRLDQQLKIRGVRVEPGEVAAVLARHPAVAAVAVVPQPDRRGEIALVAYIVPAIGDRQQTIDDWRASESSSIVHRPSSIVNDLRVFLSKQLPAALVPSAFVLLDALPLTPNGKLDRLALPVPTTDPIAESYVAPRTPLEAVLAALWIDVLKVERVSVADNFFALGGHSILIMQLIARVEELFPITLPVRLVFEAPTLGALATAIADACRATGADPDARARLPIRPRPAQLDTIPLSHAQQRLWFIQQFDPANVAYNIRSAVRLAGPLDLVALQQSLNALVARHEILRTTFLDRAGEPAQSVAPAANITPSIYDLRQLVYPRRHTCALELAAAEANHPFDLAHGSLIRMTLLQLDDAETVVLLTLHHIVCDAWSLPIVAHEIAEHYHAFTHVRPARLPALPIQYADFAYWQRTELADERFEAQVGYWKRQLAGAPELLALPTDRPRPPIQTFHGAAARVVLPDQLAQRLRVLSQRENATLAMILLAAFQLLMARYAGQTDIVVSTSRAERQRRELESLIGPFYAILLLRAELNDRHGFRTFVAQTRRVLLEAYEHDDVPFEKLVELLKPTRDPSYAPLAQVMFVFHNTPVTQLALPGLQATAFGTEKITAQYDLLLRMNELDGGLSGQLEYNTDLFDASTATQMIGHFGTLLASIVADPDRPIAALSLVSESERSQLLSLAQATALPLPAQCWPQLFEAQVARNPDVVAALCDDRQLTYQALNQRANRLAHWLVTQGIGPEVCVGLLAPRSLEFLVALVAILKAGGVYLPLDPSHPAKRIAQVLAESRCVLVLAAAACVPLLADSLAELPATQRPPSVTLDTPAQPDAPTTNLAPRSSLQNLAYVLYTSGSTGAPKGAMVEYAGMHNHMRAKISDLQLGAADTVAQNGPQSFDISVWQFLAALLVGGRVLVLPTEIARDPASLLAQIVQHDVTLVQLVPSLLQALVRELDALGRDRPVLSALRWIIPTGDALPSDLCRAWLTLYPQIPLLNNYGSTECSDDNCHDSIHQLRPSDAQRAIMPIGRAIANTAAYILDPYLAPVPIGLVGEVYSGGIAVGRGYLNNPALTAERFVPNPFPDCRLQIADCRLADSSICNLQSAICNRLYKTGDLARYLPDGRIEFVGRRDARVKLHGLRIELDAITLALRQQPGVAEAVVLVREARPGEPQLVAYVVPVQGSGVRGQRSDDPASESLIPGLRGALKQLLPSYMVPAVIVQLDALPLTPHGKLDRRALQTQPLPEVAQSPEDDDFVAPQTLLELRLAQIWAEVLGLAAVSRTANFFDLGGDSFKAIRVVRQFGTGLTLLDLFKYPLLRDLAANLASGEQQPPSVLQLLLPPQPKTVLSLVCVPYGGGSAIVYQPLAQALPKHYALYSVALPGHDFDSSAESLQSVEEVAHRCAEEILANLRGPIALYGHCAGTAIAVEIARLLEAACTPVEAVFLGGALPYKAGLQRLARWVAKFTKKPHSVGAAELLVHLRSIGGFTEIEDPEELSFAVEGYLHDDADATHYFARQGQRGRSRSLNAPIICLIGDHDPTTRNYARRYKEWRAFSHAVQLAVIPGGDHYFIKHHAQAVADIIETRLDL